MNLSCRTVCCADAPGRLTKSRSCAIEPHNPAGWETRHYEPMKTVNNSNETASPRGGVGSTVRRTQSTATQVNTIRPKTWTSPRVKGEVLPRPAQKSSAPKPSPHGHGGSGGAFLVVGGSRLGRGSVREDGRPDRKDHRSRCLSGVRAAVVARKPGNAGGAKGGRKTNGPKP